MRIRNVSRSPLMRGGIVAAALAALLAVPALASDPVGVYALVDKVVLEPSDSGAERIQVWGVFAVAKRNNPNDYEPAQRGYLYLSLRPGKEDVCRKEWADLKRVAGTGEAVGFGVRWEGPPRIRATTEKPATPDVYSVNFGMVKLGSRNATVAADLKAAASR